MKTIRNQKKSAWAAHRKLYLYLQATASSRGLLQVMARAGKLIYACPVPLSDFRG